MNWRKVDLHQKCSNGKKRKRQKRKARNRETLSPSFKSGCLPRSPYKFAAKTHSVFVERFCQRYNARVRVPLKVLPTKNSCWMTGCLNSCLPQHGRGLVQGSFSATEQEADCAPWRPSRLHGEAKPGSDVQHSPAQRSVFVFHNTELRTQCYSHYEV